MVEHRPVPPNAAEHRRWNDPYWTRVWPKREELTGVVTEVLLDHLGLSAGEHVLDIGCGGGTTSLKAARLVGPHGSVVGADISRDLVELARSRAAAQGAANVRFVVADAQIEVIDGGPFDAALSQFGVMFFDDPLQAFTNIRARVSRGGRLAFACWRGMSGNPWHIAHAVGELIASGPRPPGAVPPGPFSLSDAVSTDQLLGSAGWSDRHCAPYDVIVSVTRDALVDDDQPAFMGVPEDRLAEARAAVDRHLAAFDQGDGRYRVPLAYQVFTAANPGA
jgi:SAM-dependent methyltransferase